MLLALCFTIPLTVSGADVFRIMLEEPVAGEIHSGVGNLRGWAVSTDGIDKIEIIIDGVYAFDAPYGGARGDVGGAFPEVINGGQSGFSLAYAYSNLSPGNHTISAVAHTREGDTQTSSATFETVRFKQAFISGPDAVNLTQTSCTVTGDEISASNALIGGNRYDMVLNWRTAEQGFEIIKVVEDNNAGGADDNSPPAGQPEDENVTIRDDAAITEYKLDWEQVGATAPLSGSTHELIFDRAGDGSNVWVTGQDYDGLLKIDAFGEQTYFSMPTGSGPHGLAYDGSGQLLVSLEYDGSVAKVSEDGELLEIVDVTMNVDGASAPINPAPHGIAVDSQGTTTWFTGKRTSSIGRINPNGRVEHFELETLAAMPIYLHADREGGVWGTELLGNKILHVDDEGTIKEYAIPTRNSRPIAIVLGPDDNMWFSQEAGRKVARINASGDIMEFDVPVTQTNMLLAGLAFDEEGNLWTHGYIDANDPTPPGDDYIIRIDKDILDVDDGDMSNIALALFKVPTRHTSMHRSMQGRDGNIWFTELGKDKLGILRVP